MRYFVDRNLKGNVNEGDLKRQLVRRDRIVEVVVEEILRGDAGPEAGGAGGWDRKELR